MFNKWDIARRDVLKSLGLGAACLPILNASAVWAQNNPGGASPFGDNCKRFVIFHATAGYWQANWKPKDGPLAGQTLPMGSSPAGAAQGQGHLPALHEQPGLHGRVQLGSRVLRHHLLGWSPEGAGREVPGADRHRRQVGRPNHRRGAAQGRRRLPAEPELPGRRRPPAARRHHRFDPLPLAWAGAADQPGAEPRQDLRGAVRGPARHAGTRPHGRQRRRWAGSGRHQAAGSEEEHPRLRGQEPGEVQDPREQGRQVRRRGSPHLDPRAGGSDLRHGAPAAGRPACPSGRSTPPSPRPGPTSRSWPTGRCSRRSWTPTWT